MSRLALLAMLAGCSAGPIDPDGDPRVIWKVDGTGTLVRPGYDEDNAYFGTAFHEVLAVDKVTGRVRWRARTGGTSQQTEGENVVVASDVVVIGDVDLYAFDRQTGSESWRFVPPNAQPGFYALATDGNSIYAGSPEGLVFALGAATGTVQWSAEVPGDTAISAAFRPTYHDGVVFVGVKTFGSPVASGGLAAFSAVTGALLWFRPFSPELSGQGSGCLGGAVIFGSLVIAASDDGRIYGIERATGEVRWIAPRVHAVPPYNDTRRLVVSGDKVIATSNHVIIAGLDALTGSELWKRSLTGGSPWWPSADAEALYVGIGPLLSLKVADGATRWEFRLTPRTDSWIGFAVDGDRLYATELNGFYALRTN